MRMRQSALAVILGLFVGGERSAEAVPIVDQHFDPPPSTTNRFLGITPDFIAAQTFTVGITGILTRVDVGVRQNGQLTQNLLFDVRPTVGGFPTESDTVVLASAEIPQDRLPLSFSYISIDISSFGLIVTTGEVLAIVLRGNGQWAGLGSDPYPGGTAFGRFSSSTFTPAFEGATDVTFRTFVEPVLRPVPEPPTLILLGLGILGFFGYSLATTKSGGLTTTIPGGTNRIFDRTPGPALMTVRPGLPGAGGPDTVSVSG